MDGNPANKKFQKELSSGTVALVLMSLLNRAKEPMYGYQIAKHFKRGESSAPMIKQGTLYPVLRSLESNGLLESEVEPSVSGPPRRYYKISAAGRETLGQWTEIWAQTKSFVDETLKGTTDV